MSRSALSGDGGDELFGGYARYLQMLRFQRLVTKVPNLAFRAMTAAPLGLMEQLVRLARCLMPGMGDDITADRLKKLAELASVRDFDLRSEFSFRVERPTTLVNRGYEPPTAMTSQQYPEGADRADRMMFKDTIAYLPDDILVKVDRASMSVGLEMRAPLLDYRLVEEAWRTPRTLFFADGQGKIALRKLLLDRLPKRIVDRPKRGFGIPINEWLRGPLRPLASQLLDRSRIQAGGLFDASLVARRWSEHLSGRRNWGTQLWTILVFNAWHRDGCRPGRRLAKPTRHRFRALVSQVVLAGDRFDGPRCRGRRGISRCLPECGAICPHHPREPNHRHDHMRDVCADGADQRDQAERDRMEGQC